MADFGKVNPEKAQQIISALKDGRINDKEMKELGLTKAEAEELNKAFSSGEVQIGDFVLVNKGKGKNNKGQTVQYSETKKAEAEEEPGFWTKAYNRVKRDVKAYGENFTKAWNNSEGFLGTTGALVGATTKTATDVVKNNAEYVEKGVADITGSETAGKVVSHMAGIGFAADVAEMIENVGDWSADKIRAKAKEFTGSERQLLEAFADVVDDMNAADIALMFVGGAGAAKFTKEMPKIMKLLGIGGAGAMALTSCSEDNIINQKVDITIKANASLEQALDALLKGQEVQTEILKQILAREIQNGMTLEEILKLCGGNQKLLNAIVDALTVNNQLLTDIRNDINAGNDKILEAIMNVQNSVDVIANLIAKLPGDIKNEFQGDLTAILNAIKQGNVSLDKLMEMIQNLAGKLAEISDQIEVNGKTQKEILALLEKIKAGQGGSDAEILLQMLELLKSIDFTTKNIDNKLDIVINKFENTFPDNKEIKASLERIEQYLKENNAKTDVTNNLLEKLLNKAQNGGLTEAQLEAILNAISKNGDKIDVTNKLLADIKTGQEYILNAINKFGVDILNKMDVVVKMINNINGSDNAELKTALEHILQQLVKMDANQQANAQKILDAIAKIKVDNGGSGNVDLSSVEAMLEELIKLVGKNGEQLSNINAKLDVLNITAKAIEAKLDASNKDHKVIIDILNALKNSQCKGYDDTKLLAILDTLSGKLDDILAAIKDHDVKVTVDVTGKVTCDCNCGGNHEGILGDLDDLLG